MNRSLSSRQVKKQKSFYLDSEQSPFLLHFSFPNFAFVFLDMLHLLFHRIFVELRQVRCRNK